jgi:tetratricopeptide (TPR) repeat protein
MRREPIASPEMRREPIAAPETRREPIVAPEMRREPFEREKAASQDPETLGKENELRDEISKLQNRLDRAKSSGVDTTNIRPLLKTADKSLSEGNHTTVKQYIGYANERLGNLKARWDEARNAIKEAKDVLSGIRGTTDLTIVENFLVKADSLFEEGDYKEATKYAKKAKDRAARLQRQEMRL